MQNIYCVVGPSGSGKTTIVEALEKEYGWKTIASYTTRPPRYDGETGHTFVSEAEFRALGEMCAYTKFNGYEYGVTADLIEKNDLYVIDPAGVDFLKEKYHGKKGIVVIGLDVPVDVVRQRMQKRGDPEEKIESRLEHDAKAFRELCGISDVYVDVSGRLEDICEVIHKFVCCNERERLRVLDGFLDDRIADAERQRKAEPSRDERHRPGMRDEDEVLPNR